MSDNLDDLSGADLEELKSIIKELRETQKSLEQKVDRLYSDKSTVPLRHGKTAGRKISVPIIIISAFLFISILLLAINYFNNPLRYMKLARNALYNKNYITAQRYYEKVLERDKDNLEALSSLGKIAWEKGEVKSAIYYYKQVILIDSKNTSSLSALSELYINNKDYLSARDMADKLYDSGDKKIDKYLQLGKIFLKEKDYKNSIECFNRVLEIDDKNPEACKSLSKCFTETKDYDKVIEENKKILLLSPSDIEAYIDMGTGYVKLDKYNEALMCFRKAMNLNPDEKQKKMLMSNIFNCYMKPGRIDLAQKRYDDAENNFKYAAQINNNDKELREDLAQCYLYKGKNLIDNKKYSEAISYFDKIIDLNVGGSLEKESKKYISDIHILTGPVPMNYTYNDVDPGITGSNYEVRHYEDRTIDDRTLDDRVIEDNYKYNYDDRKL